MIPESIKIKGGGLPPAPGVYFMADAAGRILYIGKATSLRTRVASYFTGPADPRIAMMSSLVRSIDYKETPTAIDALLLESKLIKKHQPPYNVMEKDDKSFVHLVFTRDEFPRPLLIRAHELARLPRRRFINIFGPFRSAASIRSALDALRRAFPWSVCRPGKKRPCFYRHLGLCPGVCTGDIDSKAYRKIIDSLADFFQGGSIEAMRKIKRQMVRAAAAERFEEAAMLRDRLRRLQNVRDIAILKPERGGSADEGLNIFGRLEGYDISNISGQDPVGGLAVFQDGEPERGEYRLFNIKTVVGPNDTAMLEEMLRRRFAHSEKSDGGKWPLPDLILIDGGRGQLNAAKRVLGGYRLNIPLVGLAKGFDRKQDELVYDKGDYELARLAQAFKPMLQHLRDEAHRFSAAGHRNKRAKKFL